MRFLIIVRATVESEAGAPPDECLMQDMADYHDALARAGNLLDAARLRPSSTGWRIRYEGDTRTLVEGPFEGDDNLMAGYTLIEARSREEALEWARRFPDPGGNRGASEIEIRPVFGPGDVPRAAGDRRVRESDIRD